MTDDHRSRPRNRRRANGEGSIVHDKARGRYRASVTVGYDDEGRQVRRWVTGRTKKIVLERLRELQDATDAGQDIAPRDLTVRRFLEQWLTDILPGTVAETTEEHYGNVVRLYIVPHLGQKRVRTLTARDVSVMLRKLEDEGRAPSTRRLARSILRRALRWAEAEGMVSRNVAALADGVKVGRPDNAHKALTVAQARQFLEYLRTVDQEDGNRGDRFEAAFVAGLTLGLRRGELLGLSWDDLDLDAESPRMTITRNLVRVRGRGLVLGDLKTSGSHRTVHLPTTTVEAFRRHRTRQIKERLLLGDSWPEAPLGHDLVFRSPTGAPMDPDNFRQHCYRATEAAGIGRRSPHQLRHSAASLLIAQDVPMKLISELLGHSSIRITADVYGHLYDEAGAVAADAMTAALEERPS